MGLLSSMALNSIVKVAENGVPQEYYVFHHGAFDPIEVGGAARYVDNCYQETASGTWLLRKKSITTGRMYEDSRPTNHGYDVSLMDSWLTSNYLPILSTDIKANLINVTIPFTERWADDNWYKSLQRKAFIPSENELRQHWNNDQVKSMSSENFWTRAAGGTAGFFDTAGPSGYIGHQFATDNYGYRPFIVVQSSLFVQTDGQVVSNTAPVISGSNGALGTFGDTPPTYKYTVTDAQGGTVSVTEKLDSTTLRTYNVSLGNQNTLTIPTATWKPLSNGSHTLTITAKDAQGAISTRTQTFTKSTSAPVISGSNGNLGSFGENIPSYQYTVTDAQGGTINVTEKLDSTTLRTYKVTLGSQNTLTFSADAWRKVLNGSHMLTITATDSMGLTSTRTQTFTKNVASCTFATTSALPADAMPDRCVVNVQGAFPAGCSLKVEICNNGNDASPTWEDITQNALNNQKYFFTNKTKTASAWGVKIRATLSRGTGSGECYISSIGGNYQ